MKNRFCCLLTDVEIVSEEVLVTPSQELRRMMYKLVINSSRKIPVWDPIRDSYSQSSSTPGLMEGRTSFVVHLFIQVL